MILDIEGSVLGGEDSFEEQAGLNAKFVAAAIMDNINIPATVEGGVVTYADGTKVVTNDPFSSFGSFTG